MGTAEANGKLWGHRAEEWAELQEQTALPLYNQVFDPFKASSQTRCLDDGCGSGLALSEAARRGAQVSGLDAAVALTASAKRRVPRGELHEASSSSCRSRTARSISSPASTRSNQLQKRTGACSRVLSP